MTFRGPPCPECGGRTRVIDSRVTKRTTRRRRACELGHRFTTVEVSAADHRLGVRAISEMAKVLRAHAALTLERRRSPR